MDDQIKAVRSKQFFDGRPVANIQRRVCEPLGHTLQPFQVPQRVACRAEENPPHVVVHTHNFMPLPVEMLHRLRTDQPAAARDENLHPFESVPLSISCKQNRPKIAEIGDEKTAPSLEDYQQSSPFFNFPGSTLVRPLRHTGDFQRHREGIAKVSINCSAIVPSRILCLQARVFPRTRKNSIRTQLSDLPPGKFSAMAVALFLPKKTEEFLRALQRQCHQVCVISFLIAGNGQQRGLGRDCKPAVIHSNQELEDFPRCVSPCFRT